MILADREEVEQEADNILKDADIGDVAFLVVGDPFGLVKADILSFNLFTFLIIKNYFITFKTLFSRF